MTDLLQALLRLVTNPFIATIIIVNVAKAVTK